MSVEKDSEIFQYLPCLCYSEIITKGKQGRLDKSNLSSLSPVSPSPRKKTKKNPKYSYSTSQFQWAECKGLRFNCEVTLLIGNLFGP